MAFIDIDNLKHCNDVFGHDEGNRYILQVSLCYLKLYMKVDEAAFRIGGDEFAILSTIATGRPRRAPGTLPSGPALKQRFPDASLVSYGVSHADPALGEVSIALTSIPTIHITTTSYAMPCILIDAISAQVHTDDFEISDRVFPTPFRCSTKAVIALSNLDRHRTYGHKAPADLSLPLRHVDNCHDYWKTRVHPR